MQLRDIKRMYRLYMNGIVSHSMREKGSGYRVNFGLTLPLLTRIAQQIEPSTEIAEELWHDTGVRESMLLAPMVYPTEQYKLSDAQRWVMDMQEMEKPHTEVADFCCKFLFSRLPYAHTLAQQWITTTGDIIAYTGFRLACTIVSDETDKEWVSDVAEKAIVRAYNNNKIQDSAARNFLIETLLLPHTGKVVVELLKNNTLIDNSWRDNIIALYEP